ncbi:MAG: type II toxin-antitoxin system VapB family antitoxin [Rhizobium sp.]|nr:type II toxin-antitoxin system VapB family antitoxin [Rhizobium sp.]
MPLYVRDERVNQLAEQAQKILKAPTKTDAIRQALERVVGAEEQRPPLAERLEKIGRNATMPGYESTVEPDSTRRLSSTRCGAITDASRYARRWWKSFLDGPEYEELVDRLGEPRKPLFRRRRPVIFEATTVLVVSRPDRRTRRSKKPLISSRNFFSN